MEVIRSVRTVSWFLASVDFSRWCWVISSTRLKCASTRGRVSGTIVGTAGRWSFLGIRELTAGSQAEGVFRGTHVFIHIRQGVSEDTFGAILWQIGYCHMWRFTASGDNYNTLLSRGVIWKTWKIWKIEDTCLINFILMPGLQKLDRRVAVLCSLRIRQHLAVIHNSLCKLGGVGYARRMKGV